MDTDLRTAAKQALELLQSAHVATALVWPRHDCVEALKAALEQPEQEPVAWVNPDHLQGLTLGHYGYAEIYTDESQGRVPLYTAPARREWRGLTEEAVIELLHSCDWRGMHLAVLVRAVEAALKERNA